MIYNQIVTWTAFAILAMFFRYVGWSNCDEDAEEELAEARYFYNKIVTWTAFAILAMFLNPYNMPAFS